MWVVRPVKSTDFSGVHKCACSVGLGMTHLPSREDLLRKKIENSLLSFEKPVEKPVYEEYLFVLSDDQDKVGGTCGIYSAVGVTEPFYVFQIEQAAPLPPHFKPPKENRLLQKKSYQFGPSEICALSILPELRKEGLGKLLSLSRFLFIAAQRHRFKDMLLSNLRGHFKGDLSIFWEGVGRHFLDLDFAKVMDLRLESEAKLAELLPKYPLHVSFLNPEVQKILGAIHTNSLPACAILQQQGFHLTNEIDPFDGGPILLAETAQVHIIKSVKRRVVAKFSNGITEKKQNILSNGKIDFRACYGMVTEETAETVAISSEIAHALNVSIGEKILYI